MRKRCGRCEDKLAELTVKVSVPVAPSTVAWIVSSPGTAAVTWPSACPLKPVVTVVDASVLPWS